ncbi:MAG TPA: ABC transporter ATP-binding protein [Acidobacteriaceae bacterium]
MPAASSSRKPLLSIEELTIAFRGKPVVRELNLAIQPGEVLGLVGESGSGKSVTSLAILGLVESAAEVRGSIRFDGEELLTLRPEAMRRYRGRRIAMIFQEPMTALNPVMQVGRQIAEAIETHQPTLTRREVRKAVIANLQAVALPDPEKRYTDYPHQFSGGQRQRILIAMALANRPQLLIADEPTTALDVTVQAQVLKLLRDLQQQFGLAMLFISHDLAVVAEVADRVAVMRHGWLLEQGSREQIFHTPRHPYTRSLLGAVPTLETDRTLPLSTLPSATDVRPGPLVEYDIGHQARALS